MNADWHEFLRARGARLGADAACDFADAGAELSAAATHAGIAVPLTHRGLIDCSGADAQAFLHGQLTKDILQLEAGRSCHAAYCSPQGRVLANFLIWVEAQHCLMHCMRAAIPALTKRLRMYVLRSKVQIEDVSDARPLIGLAGAKAADALATLFPRLPLQAFALVSDAQLGVLQLLPDERYIWTAASAEAAMRYWPRLTEHLRPAGTHCWDWLDIRSAWPWVTPATQDEFVPQMLNLVRLDAVDFQKGCYPGQEIVARAQYLGQVKRRLTRAHAAGAVSPQAGTKIIATVDPDQSAGAVISAQQAPQGGIDLLAVISIAALEQESELRLASVDGVPLELAADLPTAA